MTAGSRQPGLRSLAAGYGAAVLAAAAATFAVVAVLSVGLGTSGGLVDRWLHRDLVPVGMVLVFLAEAVVAAAGVWVARRTGAGPLRAVAGAVLPPALLTAVFLLLP